MEKKLPKLNKKEIKKLIEEEDKKGYEKGILYVKVLNASDNLQDGVHQEKMKKTEIITDGHLKIVDPKCKINYLGGSLLGSNVDPANYA